MSLQIDKLSLNENDVIKTLVIAKIHNINNYQIINDMCDIENKSISFFSQNVTKILTEYEEKIFFKLLLNLSKNEFTYTYFITDFLYKHYLENFNKIMEKLKKYNVKINNFIMFPEEIMILENKKKEIYFILITDFIIELFSNIINDMIFKYITNAFPENFPKDFFNITKDLFNKSKELLEAHNKNINNLLT
jgi:hypothetical protein